MFHSFPEVGRFGFCHQLFTELLHRAGLFLEFILGSEGPSSSDKPTAIFGLGKFTNATGL